MKWAGDAGSWTFFNRAWRDFTGRTGEHECGEGWLAGVHDEDRARVTARSSEALNAREPFELVYRLHRHDGEYRWVMDFGRPIHDAKGAFTGYVSSAHDITERILEEQHLTHMATHDPLTDLPNRALFNDRMRQALVEARRYQKLVALLFVDLDHFKEINDTLGHEAGDHVLKAVSSRLLGCVRTGDTVARCGGDEFLILLPEVGNEQDPAVVAQRILHALAEDFALGERRCVVSASIGIALYPHHDSDVHTLLKHADMAMYRAKERGRNTFQFYPQHLHDRVARRLSLQRSLRDGIERGEFFLHFQPMMDPVRGRIVAMETLVRWRHPEFGMVSPREFICLAEETGLILPLGEWVLREACLHARRWCNEGLAGIGVAVNLTRRHLKEEKLSEVVRTILNDTGLHPQSLTIEVPECVLAEHGDVTAEMLGALHSLGVKITVEDFGTGNASPSNLKRVPVHAVKISETFVRRVTTSRDDAEITSALVTMAANLGITTIAGGVESEGQVAFLLEKGCRIMQGGYFGEPGPYEGIAALLHAESALEGKYPSQRSLPGMG